jgi:hypothetical protein
MAMCEGKDRLSALRSGSGKYKTLPAPSFRAVPPSPSLPWPHVMAEGGDGCQRECPFPWPGRDPHCSPLTVASMMSQVILSPAFGVNPTSPK